MALVRHDPQKAEDALERLASLLRHTLMTIKNADDVLLSQELDFVENYLALEHLRLGDRLRVERTIQPESLKCYLPPFTLQPLIENSIRHAIAPRPRGGSLQIKAERYNGVLCLEVFDDGPGANPEQVETSNGIGVKTVRQRLMTRHGNQASFLLQTQPGKGFSVQIKIPVE
jgi:sensor histidine kinase YesM